MGSIANLSVAGADLRATHEVTYTDGGVENAYWLLSNKNDILEVNLVINDCTSLFHIRVTKPTYIGRPRIQLRLRP